jgi:hypothetical protein
MMPLYLFPIWGISFKSKEMKAAEKNHKAIEAKLKKDSKAFFATRTYLVVGKREREREREKRERERENEGENENEKEGGAVTD